MEGSHPSAGAHLDLADRLSYGQYLHLETVLGACRPRSEAHDEVLFIIQHQATELWLKLVLHELHAVAGHVDAGELGPAQKLLARVSSVFRVLIGAWEILTTMTPADYSAFRASLDTSSGFQSRQFRELEFLLGNRDEVYLAPFRHDPVAHEHLSAVRAAPSLYDRTLALLARRGLPVPAPVLERDVTAPYVAHPGVLDAWLAVYRAPEQWWDLYELAEELVDLEDALRQWRFRHVTTVARVIGAKPGTGGTSGVEYLRARLDLVLFPELWQVRTHL